MGVYVGALADCVALRASDGRHYRGIQHLPAAVEKALNRYAQVTLLAHTHSVHMLRVALVESPGFYIRGRSRSYTGSERACLYTKAAVFRGCKALAELGYN